MGGCCSSSRKLQLQGTPVYYCYPPTLEEYDGVFSNQNVSLPTPYDVIFGSLQPHLKATTQSSFLANSMTKLGPDSLSSSPLHVVKTEEEDEDVCPTCLEEYDIENPKVVTKCNHHFHLSCILEWEERSHTCPVCHQEMMYESSLGVPLDS